jgi:lipopolysaccharide biosynthesis glycosyltransferase
MRMSDSLACVYVTDRGFLACTCFSIVTLIRNSSIPLNVFVLFSGDDAAAMREAAAYVRRAADGARVEFIPLAAAVLADLPAPKSLPPTTLGRLVMHKFLPPGLERVLYIDGDTLVDIDVAPLSRLAMGGAVVGAVPDIGRVLVGRREEAQVRLELGPAGAYFNAGVLLIDWPQWVGTSVGETCLRALVADPNRFVQADQCVLNYVCRGRWLELDRIWNYQPASVVYDAPSGGGGASGSLVHFLGGRKPWKSRLRHPSRFVRRYDAMFRTSPWASEFAKPPLPYWLVDPVLRFRRLLSVPHWTRRRLYHAAMERQPPAQGEVGR